MSFFVELWESIFTPGTSPALMKATHASFILLLLSLAFLIYYTGLFHFINLFAIATFLYAAVIWFVNELKNAKLKDNQQLAEKAEAEPSSEPSAQASGVGKASAKKRKA